MRLNNGCALRLAPGRGRRGDCALNHFTKDKVNRNQRRCPPTRFWTICGFIGDASRADPDRCLRNGMMSLRGIAAGCSGGWVRMLLRDSPGQ